MKTVATRIRCPPRYAWRSGEENPRAKSIDARIDRLIDEMSSYALDGLVGMIYSLNAARRPQVKRRVVMKLCSSGTKMETSYKRHVHSKNESGFGRCCRWNLKLFVYANMSA